MGKSLRKRKTTNEGRSSMPRVLVITDDAEREILLDELVNPEHLGSGHSAEQLVERLAWSIEDATQAEAQGRTRSHASPRSARARARSK
jgi:hypothetical protein